MSETISLLLDRKDELKEISKNPVLTQKKKKKYLVCK